MSLFLALICPIKSALCQETSETLTVNIIPSKPLGYTDEKGNLIGFHVDFFNHLKAITSIRMTLQSPPFSRGLMNLKVGDVDIGLLFKAKKREGYLEPIAQAFETHVSAIGRKGFVITKIKDLSNKRIGRLRGMTVSQEYSQIEKTSEVIQSKTYPQLINMLALNRIDVAVGNFYTLWQLSHKLNLKDKIEFPGHMLTKQQVWLYMAKKSKKKHLIPTLRKGVTSMIRSGYIDDLYMKYYGITPKMTHSLGEGSSPL